MSQRKPLRSALLVTVLVVAGLVFASFLWVRKEQRQYALNRELIDALMRNDVDKALCLVNAGADPNTRAEPPAKPTIDNLWASLWHRPRTFERDNQPALRIACGAPWATRGFDREYHMFQPDAPRLVEAMLQQVGGFDRVEGGRDRLVNIAKRMDHPRTVEVLLRYQCTQATDL